MDLSRPSAPTAVIVNPHQPTTTHVTPIPTPIRTRTPTMATEKDKKGPSSALRQRHCDTTQQQPPSSTPTSNNHKQVTATVFDYNYTNTGFYNCNICFDTAIYSVLTICGHLFCWVCLSKWLELQKMNPTCPMCKAGCSKDKIIPVYGRGREESDPRCDASIPSRPSGKRPEPLYNPNIAGSSFFHPFRNNRPAVDRNTHFLSIGRPPPNEGNQSNGFLLRLMLMILSLFIVVIVFY
ncbi:unnamed protein product [Absidia cylindrospora]